MVDKIAKAIKKLKEKERKKIKEILLNLKSNTTSHCDIKKLKGRNDIYRIGKGKIRIIYKMEKNKKIHLIAIEKRSETTYNS